MPKIREKTKTNPKDNVNKISVEMWISIGNLLLTAIIGIAVAVYLNIRNEEFQKQLVTLQNQTEIAKLDLENAITNVDGFKIINQGPAIAKNIRAVVCLYNMHASWENAITDIDNFVVKTENISLNFSKQYTRTECGNSSILGNDSLVITLDALSPDQSATFSIGFSNDLPVEYLKVTRKAHLAIDNLLYPKNNSLSLEDYLANPVNNYLEETLADESQPAITFLIDVSCDNCNINKNIEYLYLMSAHVWNWQNIEIKNKDREFITTNFDFDLSYITPLGTKMSDDELYLLYSNFDPYKLYETDADIFAVIVK